jgi:endo-1,4-beta-mannosidase
LNALKGRGIKSIIVPFGYYDVLDDNFWSGQWGIASDYGLTSKSQYITDPTAISTQKAYIVDLCQQIKSNSLSNWVVIELFDEPENLIYNQINTQAQVTDWYAGIVNTIRSVDPSIKLATGLGIQPSAPSWLIALYNALDPLCDYATAHWYYDPQSLPPANALGNGKPVLLDECGYLPSDYQTLEGHPMPYNRSQYVELLNQKALQLGYQGIWWFAYKAAEYWTPGSWPQGQVKGVGDYDRNDLDVVSQLGPISP